MLSYFDFDEAVEGFRFLTKKAAKTIDLSIKAKIKNIQKLESAPINDIQFKRIKAEREHIDAVLAYIEKSEEFFKYFEAAFGDFIKSYEVSILDGAVIRNCFEGIRYNSMKKDEMIQTLINYNKKRNK